MCSCNGNYCISPNEAMCNAVFPFFVAASTFAPLFNNSVTISTWPSFEAKCKAFKPFCNKTQINLPLL